MGHTQGISSCACLSCEQFVGNLEPVAQLYNRLMRTALEVEYPLIETELGTIDDQLKEAEYAHGRWKPAGNVSNVKTLGCDLQRVQQPKHNTRTNPPGYECLNGACTLFQEW